MLLKGRELASLFLEKWKYTKSDVFEQMFCDPSALGIIRIEPAYLGEQIDPVQTELFCISLRSNSLNE